MAFLDINDVRPNMVLASDILSQDRRILLRAGVRLSERHLTALRAMGYRRLEITTARNVYRDKHPDMQAEHTIQSVKPDIPPAKVEAVVKTLTVSKPSSEPLQPDPVLQQQTDAVLKDLFAKSKSRAPAASIAEVLRRATMRVIQESGQDEGERRERARKAGLSKEMQALISEHINT
jgi:hypothetical protein